jgi:hypothetical protein
MTNSCKNVLTGMAIEKRIFRKRRIQARVARVVTGFGVMISSVVLINTMRNAKSDEKDITKEKLVRNTIFSVTLLSLSAYAFVRWPQQLMSKAATRSEVLQQINLYNQVIDRKFPGYTVDNLCPKASEKTEEASKLRSEINDWIGQNYRCKQASIIASDAADRYNRYLDQFDDPRKKKKKELNQAYLMQLFFDRNIARLRANTKCDFPLMFPDVDFFYRQAMTN